MKQVSFATDAGFGKNKLFNIHSARDNILERFVFFKESLNNLNYQCDTLDEVSGVTDVLVFSDIATALSQVIKAIKKNTCVKLIYTPTEPPVISPYHENKILKSLPVDCILYWNDELSSESNKVFKCNIGQPVIIPKSIPDSSFMGKKFITAIYSNKMLTHPNGLYRERERAFKFFSKQKEKFDLYGVGWEKNTAPYVEHIYRGECSSKKDILQQYKYCICFENAQGYPGLITEKIFDCFAAGTVPIYYGAPNIDVYIPRECFIDFRDFNNYEELYEYLVNLTFEQYNSYLQAVKVFVQTPQYYEFTSKRYAEILTEQTLNLINTPTPKRTACSFKLDLLKIVLKNPMFTLKNIRKTRHLLKSLVLA